MQALDGEDDHGQAADPVDGAAGPIDGADETADDVVSQIAASRGEVYMRGLADAETMVRHNVHDYSGTISASRLANLLFFE